MPNTQTSVPAFVASQVLTAQQQTEINTGIPVFATTVTRDAAFGGAGEKALAEGQFAYIEATNSTQYYDGAAWQSVGQAIQIVSTITGALGTGTTTMPLDDTIPQNTEGDQYMSLAITPTSATNKLVIEVTAVCSNSAASTKNLALFQDSTANALAAISEYNGIGTGTDTMSLNYVMAAGTTSATTFKVRIGSDSAGTITFNGFSGQRKMGGVYASSIIITEFPQ
jgi:hypothetical protein